MVHTLHLFQNCTVYFLIDQYGAGNLHCFFIHVLQVNEADAVLAISLYEESLASRLGIHVPANTTV